MFHNMSYRMDNIYVGEGKERGNCPENANLHHILYGLKIQCIVIN